MAGRGQRTREERCSRKNHRRIRGWRDTTRHDTTQSRICFNFIENVSRAMDETGSDAMGRWLLGLTNLLDGTLAREVFGGGSSRQKRVPTARKSGNRTSEQGYAETTGRSGPQQQQKEGPGTTERERERPTRHIPNGDREHTRNSTSRRQLPLAHWQLPASSLHVTYLLPRCRSRHPKPASRRSPSSNSSDLALLILRESHCPQFPLP